MQSVEEFYNSLKTDEQKTYFNMRVANPTKRRSWVRDEMNSCDKSVYHNWRFIDEYLDRMSQENVKEALSMMRAATIDAASGLLEIAKSTGDEAERTKIYMYIIDKFVSNAPVLNKTIEINIEDIDPDDVLGDVLD